MQNWVGAKKEKIQISRRKAIQLLYNMKSYGKITFLAVTIKTARSRLTKIRLFLRDLVI